MSMEAYWQQSRPLIARRLGNIAVGGIVKHDDLIDYLLLGQQTRQQSIEMRDAWVSSWNSNANAQLIPSRPLHPSVRVVGASRDGFGAVTRLLGDDS